MNGYELYNAWDNFLNENSHLCTPSHTALFFCIAQKYNNCGKLDKFQFPTDYNMQKIGIRSRNTYCGIFNKMIEFGVVTLVQESRNIYQAKIISINSVWVEKWNGKSSVSKNDTLLQNKTISESSVSKNDTLLDTLLDTLSIPNINTKIVNKKETNTGERVNFGKIETKYKKELKEVETFLYGKEEAPAVEEKKDTVLASVTSFELKSEVNVPNTIDNKVEAQILPKKDKPAKHYKILNIDFEDFWNAYNKKVGSKKDTEKLWYNLTDAKRTLVMSGIVAYVGIEKHTKSNKDFLPYPTTFLRGEYYLAEDYGKTPLQIQNQQIQTPKIIVQTPIITQKQYDLLTA